MWSLVYKYKVSVLLPLISGLGYLGYMHYDFDLDGPGQWGIGLFAFPFLAAFCAFIGGFFGFVVDQALQQRKKGAP